MKLTVTIDCSACGLFVLFRRDNQNQGTGFVVKPASRMMHSEREGGWRGFRIGSLYFRTYAKRTKLAR